MSTAAEVRPPPMPATRSTRSDLLEMLASMRFAIALLTVICIASAIGTILQQAQPLVNYVDAFGPYWAEVFGTLGLFRVYSAPWFLVILAFLVISTSLCIARNAPKIIADLRSHKEELRVRALDAFHHRAQGALPQPLPAARDHVLATLKALGWQVKAQERLGTDHGEGPQGVMIAARRGSAHKLGYLAAHSAIVLVCLGGLFDGEMVAKAQAWWFDLQPFKGGGEVPANSRLSVDNPAYRAQLFVPEGQRSGAAVLNLDQGMLVQPLPFEVELRKFIVDYYSTGMPKRFASEIVVHDARNGSRHEATVEVNKPFIYDGVTIFQSSFEDGGSQVNLRPVGLRGQPVMPGLVLTGTVGGQGMGLPRELTPEGPLTLELTGLRPINVEDLARAGGTPEDKATDVRGVNLDELGKHLGSGAKGSGDKKLTNIGPSVTYKLRDAAGQAHEFQNYMVPVTLDGLPVFLLGVRSAPSEPFRFLRIPADENMQIAGWLRMRQALADAGLRREAVRRFVAVGAPADQPQAAEQLQVSAARVLDLFAGAYTTSKGATPSSGFQALTDFLEQVVPEPERNRTAETLLRILNGTLFQLLNAARQADGLSTLQAEDEATQKFMTAAVVSLSDVAAYPAPVLLLPEGFEQRQASVFQVTRTPGRNVVYLGCALLILGVFAMLYVRDRRVWVWLEALPGAAAGTPVKMALSSTRQTLDTDAEFNRLRQALLPPTDGAQPGAAPATPTDEVTP